MGTPDDLNLCASVQICGFRFSCNRRAIDEHLVCCLLVKTIRMGRINLRTKSQNNVMHVRTGKV